MQILETNFGGVQVPEERRDAGALTFGVIGVDELGAVGRKRQPMARKRVRHGVEPVMELERQLLLAKLAHQRGFVLDQDQLSLIDHSDSIGHFLGFFDIMGC